MVLQKICVLIIVTLIQVNETKEIFFGRVLQCKKQGESSCQKWSSIMKISVSLNFYYYMCFPQTTFVQTPDGPLSIRDIKVGDEILGFNFNSNAPEYTKVQAWLHRDTISTAQFTQIKTTSEHIYSASSGHNIAYNQNGRIGFKYADELEPGEELISLSSSQTILSIESKEEKGMFAPFTQLNNFYIYPSDSIQQSPMILVHCLSQIDNPKNNQHWIHSTMHIFNLLNLNSHINQENEVYLHPITHLMKIVGQNHYSQLTSNEHEYSRVNNNNNQQQEIRKMVSWFSLFSITMNSAFII